MLGGWRLSSLRFNLHAVCIRKTTSGLFKKPKVDNGPVATPPKATVVQTTVPTLYTTSDLDANISFNQWGHVSKKLYSEFPSYVHPQQLNYKLPSGGAPEFAFVGRSNVGKSSLIDLLLGNQKLVRVSKEPGCTRNVNFYGLAKENDAVSSHTAYLVDLPGYGFAKMSSADQQKWGEIILTYISNRDQSVLR
jgi:ribosome biogenesis GTPase A